MKFYVTMLGLKLTGKDRDVDPTWIELQGNDLTLQFYSDPPDNTPSTPVLSGSLYLYTDDIGPYEALIERGIVAVWGPESMPYGVREMAIQDPNGYLMVFAQPVD